MTRWRADHGTGSATDKGGRHDCDEVDGRRIGDAEPVLQDRNGQCGQGQRRNGDREQAHDSARSKPLIAVIVGRSALG